MVVNMYDKLVFWFVLSIGLTGICSVASAAGIEIGYLANPSSLIRKTPNNRHNNRKYYLSKTAIRNH